MSILSIILDFMVLAGLGVMIYYCLRLSRSLNAFRQGKEEFGRLVKDLSDNIAKADQSIKKLKDTALTSGEELQIVIDRSKGLIDELELMNGAGDSLAQRLEKLAEKNRIAAQELSGYDFEAKLREEKPVYKDTLKKAAPAKKRDEQTGKGSGPSFFIQDRDFDDDHEFLQDPDEIDDEEELEFESEAERELYKALKNNGKA